MRAAVHTRYGPPEVVTLRDVPKPSPEPGEVLVRVHATTVNRTDCGFRRPEPVFVRLWSGLRGPRTTILGSELAGVVEAVGRDVTSFREGDAVFGLTGDRFGAHAEYACVAEHGSIALKPSNVSFEQAAAVPDGAMLALGYLRRIRIRSGQSILVNGASGSIGSAAVQLARHLGAEVTAVCDTKNLELVRALGAVQVVDYTRVDFTTTDARFDVVFDAVSTSSFGRCRGLLKEGGAYLPSDLGFLWQNPVLALATSRLPMRRVVMPIPRHTQEDVAVLGRLMEAGRYRAVIDRSYPLEEIVDAYRYVETGQKTGNVVIVVAAEGPTP